MLEVCFEGDCLLDAGTVTESVLEPKEVLCSPGSGNITGRDVVTRLSGTEVPLMSGAWFVVLVLSSIFSLCSELEGGKEFTLSAFRLGAGTGRLVGEGEERGLTTGDLVSSCVCKGDSLRNESTGECVCMWGVEG